MNQDSSQITKDNSSAQGGDTNGLTLRIISALVLVPIALYAVYAGGWLLNIWILLFAVLMSFEWARLIAPTKTAGEISTLFGLYVLTVAALSYWGNQGDWTMAAMTAAGGGSLAFLIGLVMKLRPVYAFVGIIYIALPLAAILWIRLEAAQPVLTLLWLLFIVWATDTGGFFAGKSLGGPKLAPRISPNKTWSGALGGVGLAVLVGLSFSFFIEVKSILDFIVLSVVLSAISQVGDLFESALKRRFGVKDISGFIPGHGGAMDRIDGLVFVLMAAAAIGLMNDGQIALWSFLP